MVDRGVGKTEEGLLRHSPLQFAGLKQIRREPVGVIAADGTEDQIDLRVPERLQQILRPPFRMRTQRFEPRAGMGQEPDLQAVVRRRARPSRTSCCTNSSPRIPLDKLTIPTVRIICRPSPAYSYCIWYRFRGPFASLFCALPGKYPEISPHPECLQISGSCGTNAFTKNEMR